jgi:hypothetical protein
MLMGLIWLVTLKVTSSSDGSVHGCQMVMAASFLLWGVRSIELLSFFKFFGPLVSMLKSLVMRNLVSFLVLLLVIFCSFGVFFFNLLYPGSVSETNSATPLNSTRSSGQTVRKIWTLPLMLAFGLFERDDLKACGEQDSYEQWTECPDSNGFQAFDVFFVFVFLLVVNIVMWNLLIALFSQTVVEKQSRAKLIWRKKVYEMLKEIEVMSFCPPPISVFEYLARLAWHLYLKCSCTQVNRTEPEVSDGW